MTVLRQLSYVSAKHLGDMGLESMKRRGRMQKGMWADIVVLDQKTVTDNSTYEVAWKPTTGMAAVLVNGTVVVRDDRVLRVYPGQPVRFDPTEPKFETISPEQWGERFTVKRSIRVGSGIGPLTSAPVRFAVFTISFADMSRAR